MHSQMHSYRAIAFVFPFDISFWEFSSSLFTRSLFFELLTARVLLFVGFVRKVFSKAALRNICNTSIDVIGTIFFFIAISNEKLR